MLYFKWSYSVKGCSNGNATVELLVADSVFSSLGLKAQKNRIADISK